MPLGSGYKSAALLLFFLSGFYCSAANAERHALLIGISDYSHVDVPDLEGPRNDVRAMRDTLVSSWGFDNQQVEMLVDGAATGDAMRQRLLELQQRSAPGDHVFIYFSGHASSAFDQRFGRIGKLPDSGGTLVAYDFDPQAASREDSALLIGSRDLQPLLRALDKDRAVWLVVDASYSGAATQSVAVRSVNSNVTASQMREIKLLGASVGGKTVDVSDDAATSASSRPLKTGGIAVDPLAWKKYLGQECEGCTDSKKANLFEYDHMVFFGAAASNQTALDIRQADIDAGHMSTHDGLAHGAFSEALIRVLRDPGVQGASRQQIMSYGQVFALVKQQLHSLCSACTQTPVALPGLGSSNRQLLDQALFQGPADFYSTAHMAGNPIELASTEQLNNPLDLSLSGAAFTTERNALPVEQRLRVQLSADLPEKAAALAQQLADLELIQLVQAFSDVRLEKHDNQLLAKSDSGRLLTRFDTLQNDDGVIDWLKGQAQLKQRRLQDARLSTGKLRVELNHALDAPQLRHGDTLTFRINSEIEANLLVLLVDSVGDLSILYPASERELKAVLIRGAPLTIPAAGETPIVARPPAGSEQLLFYALPSSTQSLALIRDVWVNPPLNLTDTSLQRFYAQLDSGQYDFGSAHLQINTTP